jgi:uncharacterized OB-fold protein
MTTPPAYQRTLPVLSDENRLFWTSGEHGVLQMLRCQACGHWVHPSGPVCPKCLSYEVKPEALSGKGEVFTYTLNVKSWAPGLETPYTIAIVLLDEQPGLQLMTNIVGIAPEAVRVGMRVVVTFEQDEDIWLPMFRPDEAEKRIERASDDRGDAARN